MPQTLTLRAADGHSLDAYRVEPKGKARGAIVVVQEIFGVTQHIKDVAQRYADAGYVALAPALFDRQQRGVDLPYTDLKPGIDLMMKAKPEQTLLDLRAAIDAVAASGKVGMVGYCWGGTMTYLATCHLPLAAAVSYYGGGLPNFLDRTPKCPVQFHFGAKDAHIPLSDVEKVKKAYPLGNYYVYDADHGFNCDHRASYDAASAKLAFDRALEFFHRHVG